MSVRRSPWILTFVFLCAILVILVGAVALFVYWMGGGRGFSRGDQVAVVRIEGMIRRADGVVEALRRYDRDSRVKAIVLRIESPGGAVGPTQEIFEAVKRVNSRKKVVASLGAVAASGGYYAACAAERIVANPGTITGSIGVVVHFANLEKLMEKLGIKGEVIKSGAYKDMGLPHRGLTEEERELIKQVVDDVHGQFVEAVAVQRGLPMEEVQQMADGRIFSGRQAKELGLVDRLGGLHEAIRLAARLGGIQGEPQVVEEPRESFSILRLLLGRGMDEILPAAQGGIPFVGYLMEPPGLGP
jgi:protease-4